MFTDDEQLSSECFGYISENRQDPNDTGPKPPSDNFLLIYACQQGGQALKSSVAKGSLFILEFCEFIINDQKEINKNTEVNFQDVINRVRKAFVETLTEADKDKVQRPVFFNKLKKKLVFNVHTSLPGVFQNDCPNYLNTAEVCPP